MEEPDVRVGISGIQLLCRVRGCKVWENEIILLVVFLFFFCNPLTLALQPTASIPVSYSYTMKCLCAVKNSAECVCLCVPLCVSVCVCTVPRHASAGVTGDTHSSEQSLCGKNTHTRARTLTHACTHTHSSLACAQCARLWTIMQHSETQVNSLTLEMAQVASVVYIFHEKLAAVNLHVMTFRDVSTEGIMITSLCCILIVFASPLHPREPHAKEGTCG